MPAGLLSFVAMFPLAGTFANAVAVSSTGPGAVTVITKVSVGQLLVWPGAHTGIV
ncbi:MAG: hypothetical protein ORN27_03060 [Rhodoluna sp.]|nr:hypothetical protein [Rhodoluna sp.]